MSNTGSSLAHGGSLAGGRNRGCSVASLLDYAAQSLEIVQSVNWLALRLALRGGGLLGRYLSHSLQYFRELSGHGLPCRDPLEYLRATIPTPWQGVCVKLPAILRGGAGTQPAELAYLASICALLQPQVVFEIGTYTGLTTAVFVLNAPPGARVISLDLPPHPYLSEAEQARYLDTDLELIRERHLAKYLIELGLEGRYEQLLIDSMAFDPTPYAETVDLAFIDGAHSLAHVRNDTEKVARMLRTGGLVVWHDYGGRGRFRGLTSYLERLGRRARIYHVSGTTLAWATADELKAAVLDR